MKLTSAALLTFLFVLGALWPSGAKAASIVLRVPYDPVPCTDGVPPEGYAPVQTLDGYDYVEVNDQDFTSLQLFANCTGDTVDNLYVLINNVVPGSVNPIVYIGTDFDASESGPVPLPTPLSTALDLPNNGTVLEYGLVCPDGDDSCTGMLEGDVGAAQATEPTAAQLLLFVFGLYALGLCGWKGWKTLRSRLICQARLAVS